jgi:hypothetical protein
MDYDGGGWEIPEELESFIEESEKSHYSKYYFIPEEKISYGLKFHKFFLRHVSEYNKNLEVNNTMFIDEVIRNFNEFVYADEIESYAKFLGISDIIFNEAHIHHNFFYYDFINQEEFYLILKYKLLYNDTQNQRYIDQILTSKEIQQLHNFVKKYKIEKTLSSIDEITYHFITRPFEIGAVCFISGILRPIDTSSIDVCTLDSLSEKVNDYIKKGHEIVDDPGKVKDSFYYFYDENSSEIANKFL